MFLFDQSSGHCAYADNALIAHKMMGTFLRDTVWDSKPQKMETTSGLQKRLKTSLEERGISTAGLKKEDMVKNVQEMRDFKFQRLKWTKKY